MDIHLLKVAFKPRQGRNPIAHEWESIQIEDEALADALGKFDT